jgi:uncharacterized protein YndB with AHSA1/START domain
VARFLGCDAGPVEEIRSDRSFRFPVGPDELWSTLTDVRRYRQWWPWLRRFMGDAFAAGTRWRCVVRSPLHYRVRFDVVLDEVVEGHSAAATIGGDIEGHARLDVFAAEGGSHLRLVTALSPASVLLRALSLVAPGVARYGHDRLLEIGVRQFRAGAIAHPTRR